MRRTLEQRALSPAILGSGGYSPRVVEILTLVRGVKAERGVPNGMLVQNAGFDPY